jgi:hypothetical protein
MIITVIDGMGGGIGARTVAMLKERYKDSVTVYAIGTNAMATSSMLSKGADKGATGENAMRVTLQRTDLVVGPMAIMMANSMMGEITTSMTEIISTAPAHKLLIPISCSGFTMVAIEKKTMKELIQAIIEEIDQRMTGE